MSEILSVKPSILKKTDKTKQIRNPRVVIESGTNPKDAANRIRDRLGDDYAEALADALRKA